MRVDVEDTGIGIAGDNLESVLLEFFREKRPETRDLEGSGLGLSIVKRLTERAGDVSKSQVKKAKAPPSPSCCPRRREVRASS